MDDLISRQAAIDEICKACSMEGDYHKCEGYSETSTWCDELVALRAVPSAQPMRKRGKWIEEPNCWYRCSLCGEHYPSIRGYMSYKFCPNCGSYNGGDKDEN